MSMTYPPYDHYFDRFKPPTDEDIDLDRQADIEAERADQKHEQDATRDGED